MDVVEEFWLDGPPVVGERHPYFNQLVVIGFYCKQTENDPRRYLYEVKYARKREWPLDDLVDLVNKASSHEQNT